VEVEEGTRVEVAEEGTPEVAAVAEVEAMVVEEEVTAVEDTVVEVATDH
jgi:hypothetical protein